MAPMRLTKKSVSRTKKQSNINTLIARALQRREEHKVYSTQASGATISSTGSIITLSQGIIEGIDINMRTGTVVRGIKQHFRLLFRAAVADQSFRVVLFRDLFNAGVAPIVSDVLPTSGILSHYSDVRELQQKRYHILVDQTIDCSLTGPAVQTREIHLNGQYPINYNGATNIVTANGRGAIFCLFIGSNSTGTFDWDWQMEYTDS